MAGSLPAPPPFDPLAAGIALADVTWALLGGADWLCALRARRLAHLLLLAERGRGGKLQRVIARAGSQP